MATILHIDTANTIASIMLASNGAIQQLLENKLQNEHASFLHPAIQAVLEKQNLSLNTIDAIAVANGPGSYTGLRVGLAAAKGICYVLSKPIICINNLEILANATRFQNSDNNLVHAPMIDARRMEVFTAVYGADGNTLVAPHAEILDANSFSSQLDAGRLLFSGTGVEKWKNICKHHNALFSTEYDTSDAFARLAHDLFMIKNFADLAYVEPFYVKDFHFGN